MIIKKEIKKSASGQVMLLTTLVLSGTLLAATTLSGLLMVYQIRQSSNASQSAKAVFAADAGIEYELFRFYTGACSEQAPTFSNNSETSSEIIRVDNANGGQDVVVRAKGLASRNSRAFSLNLGELVQPICTDP